jgi:hypothetical protein
LIGHKSVLKKAKKSMWWLAPFVAGGYNKAEPSDLIPVMPASGDVIDPALRPGVTANDTSRAEPYATNNSMFLDGLQSVMRARWVVATDVAVQWRNYRTINTKNNDAYVSRKERSEGKNAIHDLTTMRSIPSAISACSVARSASCAPASARTTMTEPTGTLGRSSAAAERSLRRTLLRATALPVAFETMKPNRTLRGCSPLIM